MVIKSKDETWNRKTFSASGTIQVAVQALERIPDKRQGESPCIPDSQAVTWADFLSRED